MSATKCVAQYGYKIETMKRITTDDATADASKPADAADITGCKPQRICVACRSIKPRAELIRLTVHAESGTVFIHEDSDKRNGRSAYLCNAEKCVTQALKGTRLKAALEGRKAKNLPNRRSVKWPLEPQLIQWIWERCAEALKTCHNTERKE